MQNERPEAKSEWGRKMTEEEEDEHNAERIGTVERWSGGSGDRMEYGTEVETRCEKIERTIKSDSL